MKAIFVDTVAESRESFLDLVRDTGIAYYEVYSGTPSGELESLFVSSNELEKFIRFDMQKHSAEARSRFCSLSDLERRAYGFLVNAVEKPTPYFGAFVPGIGHVGIAWTSDEVRDLIARARKDEERMRYVSEEIAKGCGPKKRDFRKRWT